MPAFVFRTLIAALVLALPALVCASGEAHADERGHGGIPWATLAFTFVNFLIFAGLIRRYALPVVRDYARARHDRIVAELEAAAKARAEAEQLKAQCEARLASLENEIKQIRAAAAADTAREREQILAAAKKTAEMIGDDARRTAAQEVRQAEVELRQAVARQAVSIATQLVSERLTAADHERFASEFLAATAKDRIAQ
ncbi:MAG: ATP synthase F0 subunit B [Deltaproteobacteria bacterium]|nr:ATP synthase F0 subunit B [Deltaproteobacteria bacterium]